MFEYEIKRFNRRCSKTDHEFKPGDVYYSALIEADDHFVRMNFAASAWDGPPAGAIGWWRCQVAALSPNRAYWAPVQVLLDYFGKLAECPEKHELYYLMALVLLRKKILQLVESKYNADGFAEMVLHATRVKRDFTVRVCDPPRERLEQLQNELCEQLFTDQPIEAMDAESAEQVESN